MPDLPRPEGPRCGQSKDEWAAHVRSRLSSLRLSPVRENEIVEELSQHLEDRLRELLAGGMSEDQARHLCLAEFRDDNRLARSIAALAQARTPLPATPGVSTSYFPVKK